jgi:hypothetical protein
MFRRFFNWLKGTPGSTAESTNQQQRRRVSAHNAIQPKSTRQQAATTRKQVFDPYLPPDGAVESGGTGKNILIRNKYVREETGTHETLRILDDSMIDSGEEDGIDPYNSGEFDRGKNWDVRFRS